MHSTIKSSLHKHWDSCRSQGFKHTLTTCTICKSGFLLFSHHEVIVVIYLINRSSQTKRDTETMISESADEAYNAVDENRPAAYVAVQLEGENLPGTITIGDNDPDTDEPLRMGFGFEFFLRTYPLDVSVYLFGVM